MTQLPTATMKFKPLNLDKITERIEADEIGKHDLKVDGRDLEFTKRGTISILDGYSRSEFKLNDWAFGQLCTKIGVPSNYLRKCPITGKGSQKDQIDLWKETIADKKILLRVKYVAGVVDKPSGTPLQGFVRAVLMQSYGALDNKPLWRLLRPFIQKNGLIVQSASLTDQSLHVRALYPDILTIPTPTDKLGVHFVGLHTANSEIGARYLTGDFVVWRQICTNGMIAHFKNQSLFKQKHSKVDLTQLRLHIASGLEGVHHHRGEMVEALIGSRTVLVKDPLKSLSSLLKREKQPIEVMEMAASQYEREPIASKFGLAQAITAAARLLKDADKRMELEAIAGKYLLGSAGRGEGEEVPAEAVVDSIARRITTNV